MPWTTLVNHSYGQEGVGAAVGLQTAVIIYSGTSTDLHSGGMPMYNVATDCSHLMHLPGQILMININSFLNHAQSTTSNAVKHHWYS